MPKNKVITEILHNKNKTPKNKCGVSFAPSNIALCKYWGKRNELLNLPLTNSLSISLGDKGATTKIEISESATDKIYLNGIEVSEYNNFYKRISDFLNLFRFETNYKYIVQTTTNIPVAAGVASSACGFAALAKSVNNLFGWELEDKYLSIIARLGSGSASRSIWHGFVEWHKGLFDKIGMDSYAERLDYTWEELRVGLLLIDTNAKKISSREAMRLSVLNSPFYSIWPEEVSRSINLVKKALEEKNFSLLGETTEKNAICMHAIMQTTTPPILYSNKNTIDMMHKIWDLRKDGMPIYFTQDAGPNLKLLFLEKDLSAIKEYFPDMQVAIPFHDNPGLKTGQ